MDYKDLYIRFPGHPDYAANKIFTEQKLEQVITKLEVVLFTNKGELLGDPEFGADLLKYLWRINISKQTIASVITEQISRYIPELVGNYELDIQIYPPNTITDNPYDAMRLIFNINGDPIIFVV